MALVTLDDMAAFLNRTDRTDDPELQGYIDAVTAVVERHLGQVVEQRTITGERHVVGRSGGSLVLRCTPVIEVTAVVSSDGTVAWDTTLLDVDPVTGLVSGGLGPALSGTVLVTYEAGMAVVPANIKLAAEIIVGHLWETQRMSALTPQSSMDVTLTPTGFGFAIPNRAAELLGGTPPVIA